MQGLREGEGEAGAAQLNTSAREAPCTPGAGVHGRSGDLATEARGGRTQGTRGQESFRFTKAGDQRALGVAAVFCLVLRASTLAEDREGVPRPPPGPRPPLCLVRIRQRSSQNMIRKRGLESVLWDSLSSGKGWLELRDGDESPCGLVGGRSSLALVCVRW